MTRLLARLLVIVFLTDLFGVAGLQAAPDSHDAPVAYSQGSDGNQSQDLPGCSHACHVAFHFVALPVISLAVPVPAAALLAVHGDMAVLTAPTTVLFHPPRALG